MPTNIGPKTVNRAEINGKIFIIDMAADNRSDYDDIADQLEYLGQGLFHSHNGTPAKDPQITHFWRRKDRKDLPETPNSKVLIDDLMSSLDRLQFRTIGLFFFGHRINSEYFDLVISEEGDLLHTITIGRLGGISQTHVPKSKGIYKKFPDGTNLLQFKSNPFALDEFIKSFNK